MDIKIGDILVGREYKIQCVSLSGWRVNKLFKAEIILPCLQMYCLLQTSQSGVVEGGGARGLKSFPPTPLRIDTVPNDISSKIEIL